MAREWDNGPGNQSSAGSLGCGEATPPSRSRAVSPRVAESRSSRTRWRTPTCRNCHTAATHGPLSRRSVGERNRAARSGRGHQPRLSGRTKGRPLLALPPASAGARRPRLPGPVTANAPRPARAPESSSPAPSPYRELFLLLGSTPLKVVVVVMAPRGEVGWRRENAEGDWDQPAETAPQSPPAALHEPLPLWGSPDTRFIGLPGPTLRGSPLASLKGSLHFYWFPTVLLIVRHEDGLRWPRLRLSPAPFLYRHGPLSSPLPPPRQSRPAPHKFSLSLLKVPPGAAEVAQKERRLPPSVTT